MASRLSAPKVVRFHELTEADYFGPEVNPDAPAMGAYRKNKFK